MSRKRDEKIRELAEKLTAVIDEIEAAIAELPERDRIVLTGPGGETAESDEGEPLNAP